MNFESIKTGFLSYLQEKLEKSDSNEQQKEVQNSSLSIFLYGNEFKDYLIEEVGADISIFSKNINEIMEMDFVNGKLVDNSDSFEREEDDNSSFITDALNDLLSDETFINSIDLDQNGNLDKEEVNSFLSSIADEDGEMVSFNSLIQAAEQITKSSETEEYPQTDNNEDEQNNNQQVNNEANDLLNNIYQNKTVLKQLDTNGDGKLSDEEKAKFEEFIKENYSDTGELTPDAIKAAMDDIIDGKFSYDKSPADNIPIEKISNTPDAINEVPETNSAPAASQTTPSSGSGSSIPSSGGSSFSPSSVTPTSTNKVKSSGSEYSNMTLEELESKRSTKETELQEAQGNINKVYSGENEAVKTAQDDYEQARTDYDNAVKNDDKISSTLKDQREQNLNDIEQTESDIDNKNIEINNQEASIAQQETTVAADQSNLNALKSALQALPSSDDDPEKQAEIASKRTELQNAIQAAETKLQEDKTALEELKTDLNTMKEELKTLEDKRDELETAREQIESDILANCSDDTKTALANFNKAKENVETVKESELKNAQESVNTIQGELDNINTEINNKKAEETQKEYKVSSGDGQELIDQLNELGLDLSKLSNELGMSEEETADYITELCNAEEWGNGCIEPLLLYAQIMQESGFDADIVGDGGAALGLGQFHTCAVQEVNNQYGTNYTNEDRANPKKALEMMVLLLKYDYKCTGSTYGMLAMYNQGHASAINESAGQTYVNHVLARIGKSM